MRSLAHSDSQPIKPVSQRIEEQKAYIASQMGQPLYDQVMALLTAHKRNNADSAQIDESLRPIAGKNRKLRELCFSLEMLIFKAD